jgi:hypothetical protein
MVLGLWWSLEDGKRDILKRFEQTLGCRAVGFAPRIAGIQAGQFAPLDRSLPAADTFQQRPRPQSH